MKILYHQQPKFFWMESFLQGLVFQIKKSAWGTSMRVGTFFGYTMTLLSSVIKLLLFEWNKWKITNRKENKNFLLLKCWIWKSLWMCKSQTLYIYICIYSFFFKFKNSYQMFQLYYRVHMMKTKEEIVDAQTSGFICVCVCVYIYIYIYIYIYTFFFQVQKFLPNVSVFVWWKRKKVWRSLFIFTSSHIFSTIFFWEGGIHA